jgi:hypothetical protein
MRGNVVRTEDVVFADQRIKDTGYTALCPKCYARYNCREMLIGRERTLALESCQPCVEKARLSEEARLKACKEAEVRKENNYVSKKERVMEREERYKAMYEDAEAK